MIVDIISLLLILVIGIRSKSQLTLLKLLVIEMLLIVSGISVSVEFLLNSTEEREREIGMWRERIERID